MALFCLALSDVLLINMWMNEIGRYEASHSHILKAVIKASERVISKQQRKIIFVVRDCTDDADRKILREELSGHMMDEGYFVSRGDIIKWLNDLLHVPICPLSSTLARSSSWGRGRSTARSST